MKKSVKKLLIWGTGKTAQIFKEQYKQKYEKYIQIAGYIDKNTEKQKSTFGGKEVYSPERIFDIDWDVILLCTNIQEYQNDMIKYLLRHNIDRNRIATFSNYEGFGILRNTLLEKYSCCKDEEIRAMLRYIENHEPGVYNMEMDREKEEYRVYRDTWDDDPYIMVDGKRLYYPKEDMNISTKSFISGVYLEQSTDSPHLYVPENREIKKDAVIVDAGAREGNFSIQFIDICKKIYIVECDKMWCRVLEKTFKPYKNKVQIINTFLDEKKSINSETLDSVIDQPIDFLKMDIEGMELKALKGAEDCLKESNAFCSICSYHHSDDEYEIKDIMESFGYKTSTSRGYMLFLWDKNFYDELDARRGVVYAEK